MIAKISFFIFPLLLILLPFFLYKKDRPRTTAIWYRLAFDNNALKMAANLLAIVIIFFHLTYFSIFPNDIGFLLSTVIMFLMLWTNYSIRLQLAIRREKHLYITLALVTIIILFIPHTLSIAYTLGAILECASIFPATGLEDFYQIHFEEEDLDRKFTDAYFK